MSSVLQTLANLLGLVYSPSGTAPQLKAFGVDADIDINLVPKGDGVVLINGLPLAQNITETFTLTPAQTRTLQSSPIDLVVPANANTFLAPGQCVFVGAQGSGAYSSAIDVVLQYSDASLFVSISDATWDGSAPQLAVVPDALGASSASAATWQSSIGLALQVTSSGDVTGGDAPCTIILTYRAYDLTGLL